MYNGLIHIQSAKFMLDRVYLSGVFLIIIFFNSSHIMHPVNPMIKIWF